MRKLIARVQLWLHNNLAFCPECHHGYVCGRAFFLRHEAGFPALRSLK